MPAINKDGLPTGTRAPSDPVYASGAAEGTEANGKDPRLSRRLIIAQLAGGAGLLVAGGASAQSGRSDSDSIDRAGFGRTGRTDSDPSDGPGRGRR